MKRLLGLLLIVAFSVTIGAVTGPQVNEPVKIGIEKLACHPPGNIESVDLHKATSDISVPLACGKCISTEFRLVAENEKTRTTSKPCALVMRTSVTPSAVNCPVGSDRLFLPSDETQLYKKYS